MQDSLGAFVFCSWLWLERQYDRDPVVQRWWVYVRRLVPSRWAWVARGSGGLCVPLHRLICRSGLGGCRFAYVHRKSLWQHQLQLGCGCKCDGPERHTSRRTNPDRMGLIPWSEQTWRCQPTQAHASFLSCKSKYSIRTITLMQRNCLWQKSNVIYRMILFGFVWQWVLNNVNHL